MPVGPRTRPAARRVLLGWLTNAALMCGLLALPVLQSITVEACPAPPVTVGSNRAPAFASTGC